MMDNRPTARKVASQIYNRAAKFLVLMGILRLALNEKRIRQQLNMSLWTKQARAITLLVRVAVLTLFARPGIYPHDRKCWPFASISGPSGARWAPPYRDRVLWRMVY
jgi:hypothetical protein